MPAMSILFFDAFTKIGPRPKFHGSHPWSLRHLTDEMSHCSISGALVSSTGQTQYDAMHENLRLCEQIKGHDNLFPIWNVHPGWADDFPQPAEMTRLMTQHDVRAVTLYPKTNGWSLIAPAAQPWLDELERTRTLAIIDFADTDPATLETFLTQHPNLPVLLRSVWWSNFRPALPLILGHRNCHITFDACQINLGLELLVAKGCEDQLVFSSNAPTMSAGAHRAYVDWADVPVPAKTKIAAGNLVRLLKGQIPPREVNNSNEDEMMAQCRRGEPLSCLTLDMHAHILAEGLNSAGSSYPMYQGGPTGVRKLAKRMGVDGIGVMSWSGTVGVHAEQGNAEVRAAIDAYPDFFWGLATFDVMHETPQTMRKQMETVYADKRFLGIKPYPQYGIPYDDKRYDCWWEFANERGLYAGFHPVKWYKADEFASVCERFPNVTVVAYHCGGSYEVADTAIGLSKRFKNFMIEPTLTPVCCGVIDYLVEGAGADRVMYGSDLPMRDPRQQLGWVVFSRLSAEVKKQVLGGNAKRLLDRVRENVRKF